jgi:hypothetical protein
MKPSKVGYIPERLAFFTSPSKKFTVSDTQVQKVYVADASNKKTRETGKNWADYTYRRGGEDADNEIQITERDNTPFTRPQILSLEYREQGGRAFKVRLPDGYYVDMRDYVLLELIKDAGISAGGYCNGEFVFAIMGSQMTLVRVGSQMHADLVASGENKKLKPISKKDLVPGHLYRQRNGEEFVFIGHIDTIKIQGHNENIPNERWPYHTKFIHDGWATLKNQMLFVEKSHWQKLEKDILDLNNFHTFNIVIKSSHALREDLGYFEQHSVEEVRNAYIAAFEKDMVQAKEAGRKSFDLPKFEILAMVDKGEEPIIPEELKKLCK